MMPPLGSSAIVSKLNSVMLAILIALMGWTVKGVQELREKGSATTVMLANTKEITDRWALETQVLRAQINKQEIDIAIINAKLGIK